MSTRSRTFMLKKKGEELQRLCQFYRHHDSYLSGYGEELAKALLQQKIVNGYSDDDAKEGALNGFGDMILSLMKSIGDYELVDYGQEEYEYAIVFDDDKYANKCCDVNELVSILVTDYNDNEIFKGSPSELLAYIEKLNQEDD